MSARRAAGGPLESGIQRDIIHYLRLTGHYVQRMNAGVMSDDKGHRIGLAAPGTPDVWAIKNGRVLCVEVKRPGNVPTELQFRKMAELRAYGARCIVVSSVEQLQAALAEAG